MGFGYGFGLFFCFVGYCIYGRNDYYLILISVSLFRVYLNL